MAYTAGGHRVQRPEAVLQRAEEFISVGKDNDALNALHEIIRDRRHKQWSPTHELIMLRHLELCVKLRNASIAKDALYQYKALTQTVAISSLENVMKHLLRLAENKAETAQKESIEKLEEIDDLDSSDAPEALLLSVVSGAVSQDRMDRTVLSPWLRFLWDSYRNCLDLLRNNSLVETLYHTIARQSFGFCIKYQRRNEFRKLCDLLRLHLAQLQKNIHSHSNNAQRINISESLSIMQETRLIQLDTAIQMELWGEAYKSTEDLHNLMQLCKDKDKRVLKPQSLVNYYDKLALIFWKGGNFLFHSAALLQKFSVYKDMKRTFSGEEAQEQATRVLLAILSISDDFDTSSILTKHLDMEDLHLGNIRILSTLLRLTAAPTRQALLREIALLSVPDLAQESVARIYRLMEIDFAPLEAAKLVDAELKKIEALGREDYSQYTNCIRAVVATKILKGLTSIYDAIPIDRMSSIIPFYSRSELEHFLVHITKQRFLKAQVDHRENCIRFGPIDATVAGDVEAEFGETAAYKSGYETMRTHLTHLYELLCETAYRFDEEEIRTRRIEQFTRHFQIYEHHKDSDHERIMQRKKTIEQHKENSENVKKTKMAEQQKISADKEEKRRKQELERLKKEQEEAERQRKKNEAEEVQRRIKIDQLKKLLNNPLYSQIIKQQMKDKGHQAIEDVDPDMMLRQIASESGTKALDDIDPDVVIKQQREKMDTERREQTIKMLQQERKFDYFVRAFHIEEREIAKEMSKEKREAAPALFEKCEERRIEQARLDREREVSTFQHLNAAKIDAIAFIRKVVADHKEDLERKNVEFDKKVAALKEKKLEERKIQREKDRKRKWIEAQKEAKEEASRERQAEREAERETRQQAINASRAAATGGRKEYQDRREGPPKSAADSSDGWRKDGAPRQIQPPRGPPRTEERERPIAAADAAEVWRQKDAPAPRQTQPPRGPPRTEERPADAAEVWRQKEAPRQTQPPRGPPRTEERPADTAEVWRSRQTQPPRGPPRTDDRPAPAAADSSETWRQKEGTAAAPAPAKYIPRQKLQQQQQQQQGKPDSGDGQAPAKYIPRHRQQQQQQTKADTEKAWR